MTRSTGQPPVFITPADLPGPSGGTRYNRQILTASARAGFSVHHYPLPGAWPEAAAKDHEKLAVLLAAHRRVLVDGIIASAAPEELASAAAQGCEISVLVHLPLPAESGLSGAQQRRLQRSEAAALQAARTVVTTSHWAREDLQRRYGLGAVQVVIPGTDAAPLAPGSAADTGDAVPHLLFLGAVTPRKNPLQLIAALQANRHMPWRCVVAGPHEQDPDYAHRVLAACAQHSDRFAVPGAVTGQALESLWNETDLLVLPSEAETYGMVVTEAIARGVPALVGEATGAEEALRGSDSESRWQLPAPGASADPKDRREWTALLRRWLDDPQLRKTWRQNALAHRDRLAGWNQAAQRLRKALHW